MSSHLSKKVTKRSKTAIKSISKVIQPEVDATAESFKEESQDKNKETRAIEIVLEEVENLTTSHQVSFIHVKSEYSSKVLDVSEKTLIIDGKVKLNWSFYLDIDYQSEKEIDDFISKPIVFTLYQSRGGFDKQIFDQIQIFEQIGQGSTTSFDSAVSIYEAFTGQTIEDKEVMKKTTKKKSKKTKSDISTSVKSPKDHASSVSSKTKKGKKSEKSTKHKKTDEAVVGKTTAKTIPDQSEEILGMGTMDMLPLILGNQTFSECLDIKPMVSFDDDRMITYKNIPKLCVTVHMDKPIEFPAKPSILSFTLESIYNIPQILCSEDMECRVCAWIPFTDSFERKQILGNPVLKVEDVEYQMKAWPNMPIIGNNMNTTKYRIKRELDNVRYSGENHISLVIKKDNPKLVYNYVKRNLMGNQNKSVLRNYFLRYRTLLLEIFVGSKSMDEEKSKKKQRSTNFLHLMALVDISPLLYPGVTSTRVACQLSTYHEKEILKATGISESYFMPKQKSHETLRRPSSEKILKKAELDKQVKKKVGSSTASGSTKKGGRHKVETPPKTNLKESLPPPAVPEVEEEPSIKVFNEAGDPTLIIIEIEVDEPLVEARPVEDLMANLSEIIPTKPSLAKTALSIQVVEKNYKHVIQEIALDMSKHIAKFIQEKRLCQCPTQGDFLEYLRRLGVYSKYITTLARSISMLVSKKYDIMEKSLRRSDKKHHELMGKLFVNLVSHMNTILNQSISTTIPTDGVHSSLDATLFYAREVTEMKQYTAADRYYMERLCLKEDNPDVWFDYALFQLELDSPELAFEYLNEALSRKLDHVNSLILYGILLTQKGKISDAETCFMTVLVQRPRWVEGWGVLFIFYHINHNAGGMGFAEDKAKQFLEDERTQHDYFMQNDDLAWSTDILPKTVFFKTAVLLLKLRMYSWAEEALSFEIATYPGKVNYMIAAICYYQENYDHALDHLKEAKLLEGWNYAIVALTGHCFVWKRDYKAAKEEYFYVLESYDRPDDLHLLYINCTKVLSILGDHQQARRIILQACKNNPTPYTWTVAGTFFYNESDLISAEECFTEANLCNNRIPETWAFLTLINLKLDRDTEAELCYHQALKHELDDTSLIAAISEEVITFQRRNTDLQVQFSVESYDML